MATRDVSGMFDERIREIVAAMVDEAVNRIMAALLGESGTGAGNGVVSRRGPGRPRKNAAVTAVQANKEACNVAGCVRPMRSKGYCATHYQSARKYGWPMPAPKNFAAPVSRRGRPPGSAKKTTAATSPLGKRARRGSG
jgi:hypothetical protein